MLSGISGVSAYYGASFYAGALFGAAQAQSARTVQAPGETGGVWVARRTSSPETPVQPVRPVTAVDPGTEEPVRLGPVIRQGADPAEMAVRMRIRYDDGESAPDSALQEGEDDEVGAAGAQEALKEGECQTCKRRKYQDGSDDMGVSFQTPTRIAPEQVASAVRGHEMEHVVREQAKARREDRHVVSQSVTIHTDICPECGKVYVSGGTTRTVTSANKDQEDEPEEENEGFSVMG